MIEQRSDARHGLTVVFDLDGTLAHTSPDIAAALNAALEPYGRNVSQAETERMIGGGLKALLDRALERTGLTLSESEAGAVFEQLLAYYRESPCVHSHLHGWVFEAMTALHGGGSRIAVCSNKAEDLVLRILDALDVQRWTHSVIGHIESRPKKPDPEPLLLAIRKAGGTPACALMIGDSSADVGAARAAGIPVLLVPHGYGGRPVQELGSDQIISSASEMLQAIASHCRIV